MSLGHPLKAVMLGAAVKGGFGLGDLLTDVLIEFICGRVIEVFVREVAVLDLKCLPEVLSKLACGSPITRVYCILG